MWEMSKETEAALVRRLLIIAQDEVCLSQVLSSAQKIEICDKIEERFWAEIKSISNRTDGETDIDRLHRLFGNPDADGVWR
jgi:hypothetical protein